MSKGIVNTKGPRRVASGFASVALVSAMLAVSAPSALDAQVGHNLSPRVGVMSSAEARAIAESATPAERLLTPARGAQLAHPGPASEQASPDPGPPRMREGNEGPIPRFRVQPDNMVPDDDGSNGEAPQVVPLDYGEGQANTIYHYNDHFLRPFPARFHPARAVGRLMFRFEGGGWNWCSGAFIHRSMILTAGHCVHQGGNGEAGWIEEAYFVPAYSASRNADGEHYGRCNVISVYTTHQWFSIGEILDGYDVALAVCDRPNSGPNPNRLLGATTGWLGFCYENCRWPYLQAAQFGYPGNYYGGGEMTVSHHLNESVSGSILGNSTVDFLYGSGMRGGSSGGPHIVNPYQMNQDSAMSGQFPYRNIAFAVTSWGFIAEQWKIQGASPLSGVNNENNFAAMFNAACVYSRNTLGNRACPPRDMLPE